MSEDNLLARTSPHYYLMEAFLGGRRQHETAPAPYSRPPKYRLRRALAWLLSTSGRALSAAGAKLRPTGVPSSVELQGCG